MIKTNREWLPILSVQGKVSNPIFRTSYRVGRDGQPRVLTGTGGIVYNAKIGDNCMHWVADHLEAGVSIKHEKSDENMAFNHLACVGNLATIMSGEAKGSQGFVTGKHGGIEHVLAYFKEETLAKMSIDDTVMIKAVGQGMRIDGFEDVVCQNLDPDLFEKMGISIVGGVLEVPVAYEIPAVLMGSGLGSATAHSGDYDITTGDRKSYESLNLKDMRFGDIVLLLDSDNSYGREYVQGAVSVGVVVHGNSTIMGHGPGITSLISCKTSKIKGRICKDANIATYLL